jgi:hypothetical protein
MGLGGTQLADLDGDGDLEVVSNVWPSFFSTGRIVWWENDPLLPEPPLPHTIPAAASCITSVRTGDIDQDGDEDLVHAGYVCFTFSSPGAEIVPESTDVFGTIVWYENVGLTADMTSIEWRVHAVEPGLSIPLAVVPVDVNGDAFPDVMGEVSGKVVWYENDGTPAVDGGSDWVKRIIATGCKSGFPHTADSFDASLQAADLDGDGDADAVVSGCQDDEIVWYENVHGDGSDWSEHAILLSSPTYGRNAWPADMDADGDVDVLSASEDRLTLHENLDGFGRDWAHHGIAPLGGVSARVLASDLDRDGDLDVIAPGNLKRLAWYQSDGGSPPTFKSRRIRHAWWTRSLAAGDLDGDGDPDIVGLDESRYLTIFENVAGGRHP